MGHISIAAFVPLPGMEAQLLRVIDERIPLLRGLGLITDRPPILMRSANGTIIHISEWADESAIERAHSTPAVHALWKRFEACSLSVPLRSLTESHEDFATFPSID